MSRVPLKLRNSTANCWANSVFQIIANDQYYSQLFQEYSPKHLAALQRLLADYKQEQEGAGDDSTSRMFTKDTQPLRSCMGNESHAIAENSGQADGHEGIMSLFSALPDNCASYCQQHRSASMLGMPASGVLCKAPNCRAPATHGYAADIWLNSQTVRYLQPTAQIVPIPKESSSLQLARVVYENEGATPISHKMEKISQIFLTLPPKHSAPEAFHLEDMLEKYRYIQLGSGEQYDFNAIDSTGHLRIHKVIAEKREFLLQAEIPPVVPINFVRHQFDSVARKNSQALEVPMTLNLQHMFDEKSQTRFEYADFQYELYAFLMHLSGAGTASSGHYVSYVCTTPPGTHLMHQIWYECNDASITKIENNHTIVDRADTSYMAFYRVRHVKPAIQACAIPPALPPLHKMRVHECKEFNPNLYYYNVGDVIHERGQSYCSLIHHNRKALSCKEAWHPISAQIHSSLLMGKNATFYGSAAVNWFNLSNASLRKR